jgi:hypothetical protein
MYQDHQHTITRYVPQPCTKPSTCTIPNINHLPQIVSHQVHQPCTNTCTTTTASTMNQHLYQSVHQQCTRNVPNRVSTMYINTLPSISHVPYNVPTMCLKHIPYHSIMSYTMYHRIYQASTINGVPQPSTNITKRCISYTCFHIPSEILNNVSISMATIHHVSMLQEYTKNKPQAYNIITM